MIDAVEPTSSPSTDPTESPSNSSTNTATTAGATSTKLDPPLLAEDMPTIAKAVVAAGKKTSGTMPVAADPKPTAEPAPSPAPEPADAPAPVVEKKQPPKLVDPAPEPAAADSSEKAAPIREDASSDSSNGARPAKPADTADDAPASDAPAGDDAAIDAPATKKNEHARRRGPQEMVDERGAGNEARGSQGDENGLAANSQGADNRSDIASAMIARLEAARAMQQSIRDAEVGGANGDDSDADETERPRVMDPKDRSRPEHVALRFERELEELKDEAGSTDNDGRSDAGVRAGGHEGAADERLAEIDAELATLKADKEGVEDQPEIVGDVVGTITAPIGFVAGLFGQENPLEAAAEGVARHVLGIDEQIAALEAEKAELEGEQGEQRVLNLWADASYVTQLPDALTDVIEGHEDLEIEFVDDAPIGAIAVYDSENEKIIVGSEALELGLDTLDELREEGIVSEDGVILDAEAFEESDAKGDAIQGASIIGHETVHSAQDQRGEIDRTARRGAAMIDEATDAVFDGDAATSTIYDAMDRAELARVRQLEVPAYQAQEFLEMYAGRRKGGFISVGSTGAALDANRAAENIFAFQFGQALKWGISEGETFGDGMGETPGEAAAAMNLDELEVNASVLHSRSALQLTELPGRFTPEGDFVPGRFTPEGDFVPGRFTPQGEFVPGRFTPQGDFVPGRFTPQGDFMPGRFTPQGDFVPGRFTPNGEFVPGRFTPQGEFVPGRFTPQGEFVPGRFTPQGEFIPDA